MFVIRYDWRNNSVLFVHNLDEKPREVTFAVGLDGEAGKLLINLLSEDHSRAGKNGKHTLMLEAYGYRWYRVGGLDYLLKRSDIDVDAIGQSRRQRAPEPSSSPRRREPITTRCLLRSAAVTILLHQMGRGGYGSPNLRLDGLLLSTLISYPIYERRVGGTLVTERLLGQLCFADRLVDEVAGGNEFLERVSALVDCCNVEAALTPFRSTVMGAPCYPATVMFKSLLLTLCYRFSDPALEETLGYLLSFRRFFLVPLEQKTPYHSSIWRFREELARSVVAAQRLAALRARSSKQA